MYEHAPVEEIVARLSHISGLYREKASSNGHGGGLFLRNLIDNLRHDRSRLSPRLLAELSRHIPLTIGGAYRLIGFHLDQMREVDFLLNGQYTRIIESYPFYRDLQISLPELLADETSLQRNAFLFEIVRRWQTGLPIRALGGAGWQRLDTFYVQLGTEDTVALSGLPPTSVVSVEPISEEERVHPHTHVLYLLQFGFGYRCCCCTVAKGRLTLLPNSPLAYCGKYDWFYPAEVRIVGRVRSFAVKLPPQSRERTFELTPNRASAPLLLPWEHRTLPDLFHANRVRFNLSKRKWDQVNELLKVQIGAPLSSRTRQRYQHQTGAMPHTGTLINMALTHIARMSDVLRLLGYWFDDTERFSLSSWLESRSWEELANTFRVATPPQPHNLWRDLISQWGEWPTLIAMAIPELHKHEQRIMRINQAHHFNGLDPMIHPGAVALVDEVSRWPNFVEERQQTGWERPIYILRYKGQLLCGFIDSDGEHVALVPHANRSARRLSFDRRNAEIVGKIAALASPLADMD